MDDSPTKQEPDQSEPVPAAPIMTVPAQAVPAQTQVVIPPFASSLIATQQSMSFSSGPLPSPEYLAAYEKILAGTAERLLSLVEMEAASRRGREDQIVAANVADVAAGRLEARYGQWFAFALGSAALVGGCLVAAFSSPTAGTAICVSGMAAIFSGFLARKADAKPTDVTPASEKTTGS